VLGVGALSRPGPHRGKGFNAPDGYRFGFALKYVYRLRFDDRWSAPPTTFFYKVKQAWEKPGQRLERQAWRKIKVRGRTSPRPRRRGPEPGRGKDIDEKLENGGLSLLDFPTRDGPDLHPAGNSTSAFLPRRRGLGSGVSTQGCWSTSTGSAS